MRPCKKCGFDLDGPEIFVALREYYPSHSTKELEEIAQTYGWTKENKACFKLEICIEHSDIADGSAYYVCPKCRKICSRGTYWDRYVAEMKKKGKKVEDPGE